MCHACLEHVLCFGNQSVFSGREDWRVFSLVYFQFNLPFLVLCWNQFESWHVGLDIRSPRHSTLGKKWIHLKVWLILFDLHDMLAEILPVFHVMVYLWNLYIWPENKNEQNYQAGLSIFQSKRKLSKVSKVLRILGKVTFCPNSKSCSCTSGFYFSN